MTLYAVEVEEARRAVVYVRADTPDEAREAGIELADLDHADHDGPDVTVKEVPEPRVQPVMARAPVTRPVWSGGPKGDFRDEEIPASARPWFDLP